MPTPTTQITFGGSVTDDGVYAIVELDDEANTDENGNILSTFLDSERVNILVHHEPGAIVRNVNTSWGSIINATTPRRVIRTNTIEDAVFKSTEDGYQLQHFPVGGVTATWEGRSSTLQVEGRDVDTTTAPHIADLTYQYEAWQYILAVGSLNLEQGEDFKVDVSFEITRP